MAASNPPPMEPFGFDRSGYTALARLCLPDGAYDSPTVSRLELAQKLLAHGADPNASALYNDTAPLTALMNRVFDHVVAAVFNDKIISSELIEFVIEMTHLLLAHGAQPTNLARSFADQIVDPTTRDVMISLLAPPPEKPCEEP